LTQFPQAPLGVQKGLVVQDLDMGAVVAEMVGKDYIVYNTGDPLYIILI
jgi:hypothetical protein